MSRAAAAAFHCLIRTHHVTSRKKLRRVRHAADQHGVERVLVRSGGSPGIMFAESADENSLIDWVSDVQALRYKDFRCVARPAPAQTVAAPCASSGRGPSRWTGLLKEPGFHETESVTAFGKEMEEGGVAEWWKKAMGYTAQDG